MTADAGDGTRIGYQVEGPPDAPVLLLSNSIGSTRDLWARTTPAFAAHYRVVRYDARGHGSSSAPAGDYTIEQLGRDALAVLDAAGASAAHVCGISLGGLTAMWLGVHAPGRVTKLVLANTAARIGSLESWAERIALVKSGGMSAVADRAMLTWFTPEYRERDPETVHVFRAMLQSCSPAGYLSCCAALRDADLREGLASITCPVLVIGGRHDISTTVQQAEFVRNSAPLAELLVLDSAHLSNVECSEHFASAVIHFLDHDSTTDPCAPSSHTRST